MGFLLDDILLAPVKFPTWIAQKVGTAAYAQMTDDAAVRQQLLELQMRLELGEVSEEEYERREADLLKEIERIRKLKEEGALV